MVSSSLPMTQRSDGRWAPIPTDADNRLLVSSAPSAAVAVTAPVVNIIDAIAETVLDANPLRRRLMLQNVGTTRILIAFGHTPTATNFHISLPAGGSDYDGTSPAFSDTLWLGNVQAISSANGGLLQATEFTS